MNYDPNEHAITGRQVTAGWVICLLVIGLALGATASRQSFSADPSPDARQLAAATAARAPLGSARISRFVQCCSRLDKHLPAIAEAQSPAALAADRGCG